MVTNGKILVSLRRVGGSGLSSSTLRKAFEKPGLYVKTDEGKTGKVTQVSAAKVLAAKVLVAEVSAAKALVGNDKIKDDNLVVKLADGSMVMEAMDKMTEASEAEFAEYTAEVKRRSARRETRQQEQEQRDPALRALMDLNAVSKLTLELDGMKLRALWRRAISEGIDGVVLDAVADDADDAVAEKGTLISLILAASAESAAAEFVRGQNPRPRRDRNKLDEWLRNTFTKDTYAKTVEGHVGKIEADPSPDGEVKLQMQPLYPGGHSAVNYQHISMLDEGVSAAEMSKFDEMRISRAGGGRKRKYRVTKRTNRTNRTKRTKRKYTKRKYTKRKYTKRKSKKRMKTKPR
jgi:hypothetical protein